MNFLETLAANAATMLKRGHRVRTALGATAIYLATACGGGGGGGTDPDTTNPTVTIDTPAPGTVNGTVAIAGTADDDRTLDSVVVYAGATRLGAVTPGYTYSVSWNSQNAPNGTITLRAEAYDKAKNKGTATRAVTVNNVGPDVTPPTVSITAPTANQQFAAGTTQATLAVTTDENATCKTSVGADSSYQQMITQLSGAGTKSHTLSVPLADGKTYSRFVRCLDGSGNANPTGKSVDYSVANAQPQTLPIEIQLVNYWDQQPLAKQWSLTINDKDGNPHNLTSNASGIIRGTIPAGANRLNYSDVSGTHDIALFNIPGNPKVLYHLWPADTAFMAARASTDTLKFTVERPDVGNQFFNLTHFLNTADDPAHGFQPPRKIVSRLQNNDNPQWLYITPNATQLSNLQQAQQIVQQELAGSIVYDFLTDNTPAQPADTVQLAGQIDPTKGGQSQGPIRNAHGKVIGHLSWAAAGSQLQAVYFELIPVIGAFREDNANTVPSIANALGTLKSNRLSSYDIEAYLGMRRICLIANDRADAEFSAGRAGRYCTLR